MHKLGHHSIDMLKMDIERHEFGVIAALSSQKAPKQILFETHLHNAYGMWNRPVIPQEWEAMWEHLATLGYGIFMNERNDGCMCCFEWSLLRL